MFRLQRKVYGTETQELSAVSPDTWHLRTEAGVVFASRALHHAGGVESWGLSLENLEAIVIPASFIKHIPCAFTPSFNLTATSKIGVTISTIRMSKPRL